MLTGIYLLACHFVAYRSSPLACKTWRSYENPLGVFPSTVPCVLLFRRRYPLNFQVTPLLHDLVRARGRLFRNLLRIALPGGRRSLLTSLQLLVPGDDPPANTHNQCRSLRTTIVYSTPAVWITPHSALYSPCIAALVLSRLFHSICWL